MSGVKNIHTEGAARGPLRSRWTALSLVLLAVGVLGAAAGELRQWTDVDGRTMQAKFISQDGKEAVFELASGQKATVPLSRLSVADQALIRQVPNLPSPPAVVTSGAGEKRAWPDYVEVNPHSDDIKLVEDSPSERRYVYRSQSFQFVSQDKLAESVMKDVARTFEATKALVQALPWGIDPRPPSALGYFQAKLYETRKDYIADGGPENSGGVYFRSDRIFRIPFPSLGLEMRGKTWFKKPSYKEVTLVHEVTHQMMDDYLPFLPTWVIEGTAEYTEALPYNYGKFRVKDREGAMKEFVKERLSRGGPSTNLRPVGDHMTMKREEWTSLAKLRNAQHSLYFESYLLIYYFSHLDGDGKGTRFLRYLDEIGKASQAWQDFFKNPLVTKNPDGSFTYPRSLPLPAAARSEEFGLEKLDILLDGRSLSDMDAVVKEAYKKAGIRL